MDTHEFNPARGHEGEYKHESNCVVPFGGGSTDRDPAAKGHFHKALRILALAPLCGHCLSSRTTQLCLRRTLEHHLKLP